MTAYFDFHHTVTDDEIDALGHVHNVQYLRWTLGAAGAHSAACGWNEQAARDEGFGWVVRSHDITYRAAALAGDQIVVRTWISELARFASRRKYVVCRPQDETVLTRASTRWVYVDLRVHKVVAIPPPVLSRMTVCEPPPPLPWQ